MWVPQWSDEYKAVVMTKTNTPKGAPPLNLTLYKGSAHVVASRAFVEFVLFDGRASILYNWLRDVNVPDEHFFNTLNYNVHLRVPGGTSGEIVYNPPILSITCI